MADSTYLAPGTVLQGRYEIAEELGRGGYSVVYRARDRRINSDVAIKLLVPPPAAARLARERLRREVEAVRQLSHPGIVPVYDLADDGPWTFVVMAYIAGPDLAVRVRERGPLSPDAALRLGREIAAALDVAHRRGVLHRDVKPQNILLAPDGRACLTDFGSARLIGQVTVTQTGGLVGTVDYAAPEMLAGRRGDARADCYSLGVTLYYALTGELPPRDAKHGAPLRSDGHHPRHRRAEIPDWLDAAVARATMPDPDDRFPAVTSLAAALDAGGAGAEPQPAAEARETCVLCRAPEPFGIGVCPRCGRRAGQGAEVLVFLERSTPGPARRAILELLEERIGSGVSTADCAAVVAGERPLLRVPADAGSRVAGLLEARGLPSRLESRTSLSRADIPLSIAVFAGLVAAAGSAAGLAAGATVLLVTSPVVAAGLVGAAAMGRSRPVWDPPLATASTLPPDAERSAVRALFTLPAGQARSLLLDVLRRASAAAGAEQIGPLVEAACAAAKDLAGLDEHLAAFDAQRDRWPNAPAGWLDALSRCERGRDLLTQRLLEVSAALSGWQARTAVGEGDAEGGQGLAHLARGLDEEGRRQAEAAQEVEELLNGG